MDTVDETQDVVDVLDPVDGVRGVPKPCAQVRILPGARLRWSESYVRHARITVRRPPRSPIRGPTCSGAERHSGRVFVHGLRRAAGQARVSMRTAGGGPSGGTPRSAPVTSRT